MQSCIPALRQYTQLSQLIQETALELISITHI